MRSRIHRRITTLKGRLSSNRGYERQRAPSEIAHHTDNAPRRVCLSIMYGDPFRVQAADCNSALLFPRDSEIPSKKEMNNLCFADYKSAYPAPSELQIRMEKQKNKSLSIPMKTRRKNCFSSSFRPFYPIFARVSDERNNIYQVCTNLI